MTIYTTLFTLLAAIITGATALTICSRNLVHAVVYLVISFLGTGLLYFMLGAPMLAALEVIINAGAIMVLFLIVIMLVRIDEQSGMGALLRQALFVIGAGGTSFFLVAFWLYRNPGSLFPLTTAMVSPKAFGAFVFEHYWLAVEVVSFLLFVALVGAFYLSRGKTEGASTLPLEEEQ